MSYLCLFILSIIAPKESKPRIIEIDKNIHEAPKISRCIGLEKKSLRKVADKTIIPVDNVMICLDKDSADFNASKLFLDKFFTIHRMGKPYKNSFEQHFLYQQIVCKSVHEI